MKNRIRVERAELRITQQHLADVVGGSRQTRDLDKREKPVACDRLFIIL